LELAKETAITDDLYQKMHQGYEQTDKVGMVCLIPITMADLKRVEDDWLNDKLVNFFFEW
jgi:Ulp1 family protease